MVMEALNSSEKMANKWPLMSQEELLSVLPFGGQNISAKDPNLTLPYVKKDHDLIGKFFSSNFDLCKQTFRGIFFSSKLP